MVETLVEMALGNLENQLILFDGKVIDAVNFILRKVQQYFDIAMLQALTTVPV